MCGFCEDMVYPRACGGTDGQSMCFITYSGLSPRVRGNPPARSSPATSTRSIPARAGEPTDSMPAMDRGAVYPRACGGTWTGWSSTLTSTGLSPRVRGNLATAFDNAAFERSIPARAGEPEQIPRGSPEGGVYPRACGGTGAWVNRSNVSNGLSPRVRGNLPGRRR